MKTITTWTEAMRPKTLPVAAAPVLVGTALAFSAGGMRPMPALAAFIGALLLQIGVNLANDYFDFMKGVDTKERVGPVRATASGRISPAAMKRAVVIVLALAVLDGIYLVYEGGLPIAVIGICSVISLLAYSGGPYPLASHGLGDLFVFIFFGLTAVCGTFYVQTLTINGTVFFASLPSAMQITAVLVVNNLRDRETDKKSNKRTLAVMIGKRASRIEFDLFILVPYLVPVILFVTGSGNRLMLLPLISLPLCFPLIKQIHGHHTGSQLNQTLAGTARLSLVFSILFSTGFIFG